MKKNQSKDLCKPIHQFSLNGEFITEYNSAKEASEKFKVTLSAIANAARGLRQSSCGFIWKYKQNTCEVPHV